MSGAGSGGIPARFYRVSSTGSGMVVLDLVEEPLINVAVVDGELAGPEVCVSSRAVLVEEAASGELRGRPLEPLTLVDGGLCFDPQDGGVRTRENRLARGAFNALVAEATRFGMVNAFVHARRAAHFVNQLLADLGAPPLPSLKVVVGAHSGSRLPGFGQGDGDFRSGRLRPFSGGHYRLSRITSGVPELVPVAPTGEIHLGPSRNRKPFAGEPSYLRNAAHNPAIIYHEYGHHLCRHTADFRLNGERRPAAQRNGKTGIEEGVCDYLAASLIGTGQPYGWYGRAGRRLDMEGERHPGDGVQADAHAIGARWAALWWQCRRRLVDRDLLPSGLAHDRVVIAALLEVAQVARRGRGDRRRRREREAQRCAPATMVDAYLGALKSAAGSSATRVAEHVLRRVGRLSSEPVAEELPC